MLKLALHPKAILIVLLCCILFGLVFRHTIWSHVSLEVSNPDEFVNEFVAIHQQGGVTWHNFDADPHFAGLVSGWSSPVNPVDIGLYRITGTDDTPGGATVTVLFNTLGLYYYYCRNHDEVDSLTHRAQALPMAQAVLAQREAGENVLQKQEEQARLTQV